MITNIPERELTRCPQIDRRVSLGEHGWSSTFKQSSRILLFTLTATTVALVGPGAAAESIRPNILFIMSDDHTTQAIGAYNSRLSTLNPTPALDELTQEGMLFERCYCNNSICSPSRASIITGQYSQTSGVLVLDQPVPPERQYLPQAMKQAGYLTAMIGKWHLTAEPATFDYYCVLPGQGKYFDPTFDVRGPKPWPKNTIQRQGYVSDIITDLGIDWLEHRDASRPFFLMLHHKAPHDMLEYAPRYGDYLEQAEIPEPADLYGWVPHFGSVATRGPNDSLMHRLGTSVSKRHPIRNYGMDFGVDPNLTDREYTHQAYQAYLKRYLRCVKGVDDNLQRLFAYLQTQGLMDDTVIIYTSDQGMMLGEHDYIDTRWMYEESMRMPFIVRYPKLVQAGSRSDLLINNTDFAPTMLELAGATVPACMQGRSFVRALRGESIPDWRTAAYYRYWMHLMHHDNPAHFGIRTKDFKLIFYYGLPVSMDDIGKPSMPWKKNSYLIEPTPPAWELYDLRKDPFEMTNVYGDPAYRDVVTGLKQQLRETREALNETDQQYPHIQLVIEAHWTD
ncbi:MAG: sulfatase family protein [Thermoguttaceae bacterium]